LVLVRFFLKIRMFYEEMEYAPVIRHTTTAGLQILNFNNLFEAKANFFKTPYQAFKIL